MADEVEIYQRLKNDRSEWDSHWQSLAEMMLPRKADFTIDRTPGERRTVNLFDSTAMREARDLAAAVDALLKPRTQQWFHLLAEEAPLNQLDDVKLWLEQVENIMFSHMYHPQSRFIHATGEVDLDLIIFGTAILFIGESQDLRNMLYKSMPLKDTYIMRNFEGKVDTVFIRHVMKARVAEKFFDGNPGETARKALAGNNPFENIEYLQVVMPREDFNPRSRFAQDKPFASKWLDVKTKQKLQEGGFDEFPFVVPIWDSATGELYGRSPGMIALPDANTSNAQQKTLLKAGQKAVDPPLLIADDSVIGSIRTWPGANTYFNADLARELGRVPILPLETGANIPLGREMINDIHQQIAAAFFKDKLNLPVDGPQMTATEILERRQEFMRAFGPIFGRLESDYIGPMIDRTFNVLMRAGAFPPPPDILVQRDVRFEYVSPISQSKRQLEAASALRTLEILGPYLQIDPTIADLFNGDAIGRGVSEGSGMPLTWLNSADVIAQRRQQRAQQQAQLEQAQQLMTGAEGVKTMAEAASKLQS